jgi:hypothetical protein
LRSYPISVANAPFLHVFLCMTLLAMLTAVIHTEGAPEDRGGPPPELDLPIFLEDMTPDTVYNSGDVVFSVRVSDESGVAQVLLRQWQGSGSNLYDLRMELVDGNGTESVWNLTLGVPYHSLDPINYYFKAVDRYDTKNQTTIKRITILDDSPPYIIVPDYLSHPTTGDRYSLRIRAGDLIELSDVLLHYMFDDIDVEFSQEHMEGFDVTDWGSGDYRYTIREVPSYLTGNLTFFITALDASGNIATTDIYNLSVLDNDAPLIDDDSPDQVIAGDVLRFRAEVMDNIEIRLVWATYHFVGGADPVTIELRRQAGSGVKDGAFISEAVPMALEHGGERINYTITATDGSGNDGVLADGTIEVVRNSPPHIVEYLSDPFVWTGGCFTARASIRDDLGLKAAWVWHSFSGPEGDGTLINRMEGTAPTGSMNDTVAYTVHVPLDAPALMWYRVSCEDIHGQTTHGEWIEMRISDVVPPSLGFDSSDTKVQRGMDFTFRTVARDNRAVAVVKVTFWFENGARVDMDLAPGVVYEKKFKVPQHARKNLTYFFSAYDEAGNVGSSLTVEVPIHNSPPVLDAIPIWNVEEGSVSHLDLAGYIRDPDDPLDRLMMECDGENVTVNRFELRAFYDRWVPGNWILVSISDGTNHVTGRIWVVVQDVNGPPTVTLSSPLGGYEYRVGDWVQLLALYDDPDMCEGRDLMVTWSSSLGGTLLTFNHSKLPEAQGALLPEGIQVITVTVSDGEFEASDHVSVVVTGDGVERDDGEGRSLVERWGLVLLVSICTAVFLVITALVAWLRLHGGRSP